MADMAQTAGGINIEELMLIDRTGNEIDVQLLMVELNLFEDLFSNFLYGNLLLSDGLNLIEKLPIIGEEYIRVRLSTPGFPDSDVITKTFRVYAISDRAVVNDDRTQQYIIHFCSSEAILDLIQPISRTFSGRIDEVVNGIFKDYIQMPRNIQGNSADGAAKDSEELTSLSYSETKNSVKFISNRWTAAKCINWLAAKALPMDGLGASYLFFETNKQFVFASVEQLIERQVSTNSIAEHYIFSPNNIRNDSRDTSFVYKKQNLPKEYRIVESFKLHDNFNTFDNARHGYYASKLFRFDVINKSYTTHDFDYVAQFPDYKHLETTGNRNGGAFFLKTALRNPDTKLFFAPTHPQLFDGVTDNANELAERTLQNRIALMNELNNHKVEVVVAGRTDMEVGEVVKFSFPNVKAKDNTTTDGDEDKYYGGLYLITAIRHKINLKRHMMVLELVKDSVKTALD